jgi:hypothetical protein
VNIWGGGRHIDRLIRVGVCVSQWIILTAHATSTCAAHQVAILLKPVNLSLKWSPVSLNAEGHGGVGQR